MQSIDEIIPVVNLQDEIIGYKKRVDIIPSDLYRVSACWITNSQGEILLAQRGLNKSHDPGKWGTAVAGTVGKGESYLENMLKEILEEIGIQVDKEDLVLGPKVYHDDFSRKWKFFTQWFFLKVDLPVEKFIPEEGQVEQLQRFTKAYVQKDIVDNPEKYLQGIPWCLENLN